MNTRTRALVTRPGRKTHFASIAPGDTAWIAVCDRDVPVFGATVTGCDDWAAWLTAAEQDGDRMCRLCRTPLLVAGVALAEVEQVRASNLHRETLEAEVRSLRAELSRWVTAALAEGRAAYAARFPRRVAR